MCVLWAPAAPSLCFHPHLRNVDFWCDYVSYVGCVFMLVMCPLEEHRLLVWLFVCVGCVSTLVVCPCWLCPCLLCVHSRNVDFRCGCVSVCCGSVFSSVLRWGLQVSFQCCSAHSLGLHWRGSSLGCSGLNIVVYSWLPDP